MTTWLRSGTSTGCFVPRVRWSCTCPFDVLFSSMDRKVGHLRRYRRGALVDLVERAGFVVDDCRYVDSLGFFVTLLYKVFGDRTGAISHGSVLAYDRIVFPVSRMADRVVSRWFGKNLLLDAHRPADGTAT
ncbi:MAG: hypothetical protein WKF43_00910 [Acidimicrobiales bacterium]